MHENHIRLDGKSPFESTTQQWTIPILVTTYMALDGLLVAKQVSTGVYTMPANVASKTTFSPGNGVTVMEVWTYPRLACVKSMQLLHLHFVPVFSENTAFVTLL